MVSPPVAFAGFSDHDIEVLANWLQIVGTLGVVAAFIALVYARKQLRDTARASRLQALLALDDAFSRYRDLRDTIRCDRAWIPQSDAERVDVRRYLSLLDRVGRALRDELIDLDGVSASYGSSVQYLVKNAHLRELVESHERVWPDLTCLWSRLWSRWWQERPRDDAAAAQELMAIRPPGVSSPTPTTRPRP